VKIARRFNAGLRCDRTTSPEGTSEGVKPMDIVRRIRCHAFSATPGTPCHHAMMFLLVLDVSDDRVQLRNTGAKGAILFLPCKQTMLGKCFVDPCGRAALDQLKRLGTCALFSRPFGTLSNPASDPALKRRAIIMILSGTNGFRSASTGILRLQHLNRAEEMLASPGDFPPEVQLTVCHARSASTR
jgi:hypothetical protein